MLDLFYITNKTDVAMIAERAGVNRIFVDLETLGKAERQAGMDSVQSHHTIYNVFEMREALSCAKLLVRSNPIHPGSKREIDNIIEYGADYVMLPYFKSRDEVARFIEYVGGRAKTIPLVETKEAVNEIDAILDLGGIDEVYIGLNDLHLSYGMKFMFQLLADGTVDYLAHKILDKGLPFGFGGVARLDQGAIPGRMVIKEHYRLGSSLAILSRSFCNSDTVTDSAQLESIFNKGIRDIRLLEEEANLHKQYFDDNHRDVVCAVNQIIH